jgi:hypothetical protein
MYCLHNLRLNTQPTVNAVPFQYARYFGFVKVGKQRTWLVLTPDPHFLPRCRANSGTRKLKGGGSSGGNPRQFRLMLQ